MGHVPDDKPLRHRHKFTASDGEDIPSEAQVVDVVPRSLSGLASILQGLDEEQLRKAGVLLRAASELGGPDG